MPITASAKKALRQNRRRRALNRARKDAAAKAVKLVKKLVAQKKLDEARKELSRVYKLLDKAAKKNTIKYNTASRLKSRLARLLKK